ncbi:MAG: dihydropteroate synthase, partial [Wenzhouxiangellaceae bacterium]
RVDVDQALRRAETMVAEGATLVDIGGESTRPGASAVSIGEELDRVMPVVEAIHRNLNVCISVDSSSPEVMSAAIAAGAEMINDVRALADERALTIVSESSVAVCLMHMQGQPRSMQKTFHYDDVVAEVREFLRARADRCLQAGIAHSRLLIDPGFGFGKSVTHNYRLLRELDTLAGIGLPVLVGMSRKSMIAAVTERALDQRLAGSLAAAVLAMERGARIVRTHDVAATMDAIRVHCACSDA